jgi:hypothetical protein
MVSPLQNVISEAPSIENDPYSGEAPSAVFSGKRSYYHSMLEGVPSGERSLLDETRNVPSPAGTTPALPLQINDAAIVARAAAYYDSTRLNPLALGLFLPSAIPVKGDAYFGTAGQTAVTANGSGAGFGFSAPGTPFTGAIAFQAISQSTDTFQVSLPTAYVKYDRLTIGTTDSTFTDIDTVPESADLAGPIGRPMIRTTSTISAQPQIRFAIAEPDDVPGFYADVAVENPGADVLTPVDILVPGLPTSAVNHYSSFSRYPDLVARVRYQDGEMVTDQCSKKQYFDERWHLQFGTVVRDLSIEGDGKKDLSGIVVPTTHESTTGWGTQLSGRFKAFGDRDPDGILRDYAIFSVTFGDGIGHYFPDLHVINPVNDAAYNPTTNQIDPLPVFAYFGGYQHNWTEHLRSTVAYSHIDLESQMVPGNATVPYHQGDYMSINMVAYNSTCVPPDSKTPTSPSTEYSLFGGVEYLYGERETLNGAWGADQRIMVFFAAIK